MIEYKLRMSPWYLFLGFGPSGGDSLGMDEGDEIYRVGSLLEINRNRTGSFTVITATHTGYVDVTIRSWLASEVVLLPTDGWEDCAIAQVDSPTGELVAEDASDESVRTPNLIEGPGRYGVRVLGIGRDGAPPEDLNETGPDSYFVDIWPAPDGVAEQHRTRSGYGKEVESW